MDRPAPKVRTVLICKQAGVTQSERKFPVPASIADIDLWLWAVLKLDDRLRWPVLGDLPPYLFWFNAILASCFHGCRPGDLWAITPAHAGGLLWSELSFEHAPPISGGDSLSADWEFGWLRLRTNKTGAELVAPLSPHLWYLAQRTRRLDADRVFPLPRCSKLWYREINAIKAKTGLVYVSFCGQYPSRSFRKTAAVLWKQQVNRAAASHMLSHSVRAGKSGDVDDVVSNVTEQHYNGSDIFRELVEGAPAGARPVAIFEVHGCCVRLADGAIQSRGEASRVESAVASLAGSPARPVYYRFSRCHNRFARVQHRIGCRYNQWIPGDGAETRSSAGGSRATAPVMQQLTVETSRFFMRDHRNVGDGREPIRTPTRRATGMEAGRMERLVARFPFGKVSRDEL